MDADRSRSAAVKKLNFPAADSESSRVRSTHYSLEALQLKPFPANINPSERELYLEDDVFHALFNMDRETWLRLPKWKRNNEKKKHKLF